MILTQILAVVVILMFAGVSMFFALAESALFSLGKWQIRRLADEHPQWGRTVVRLLEEPQDLLATIVLGNTVSNAVMLATALWLAFREHWPVDLTVIALLMLVLLGCEVLPKTLAVRQPDHWALRVARPMVILQQVTGPLRQIAQRMNTAILKTVIPKSVQPSHGLTEAEYQELLEMGYQQGTLGKAEKEIIIQILNLDQRAAKDVMRPRPQMACISDESTLEEMLAAARKYRYRRIPMYDETPDTIVGVLNTRLLLLNPQIDMEEAIEFPSFVPESMNLLQLFKSLQRQQRGLAIVLDEFGGTAGLVTIEDILEDMVGEIRNEGETEGFVMEKLGEGRWRVNATMRLEDFQREYPALGEVPEVDTMGGLLMAQKEIVPRTGESVVYRGLRLTVLAGDERRVREVLVEVMKNKSGG